MVAVDDVRAVTGATDMRFNWVCVRMEALDVTEMRELVVDAWRMVVPKKVAAAYDEEHLEEMRRDAGR
jgi:hypothetical protein